MASSATIIILPVCGDVSRLPAPALRPQHLLPSSNRRNVVELWRVKEQREYAALCEAMHRTTAVIAATTIAKEPA